MANSMSMKELAEEAYMHDFDWNNSLFSAWYQEGMTPEKLPKEYADMKQDYSVFCDKQKKSK